MPFFPDDYQEFRRQWSSAAGELHGIRRCIVEVQERTGTAYVLKKDDVASALRDLCTKLEHDARKLSEEVQAYIEEDKRRSYEIRKRLGR